ncbi:hypothetical protein U1Q18_026064, partial [Sarracenia purpurea var. burkii]
MEKSGGIANVVVNHALGCDSDHFLVYGLFWPQRFHSLVPTCPSSLSTKEEGQNGRVKTLKAEQQWIRMRARFVFVNGAISPSSDTPAASTFLESLPGAYTTTRTHNNGSLLLFWERHLQRLADSARILLSVNPNLLFKSGTPIDPFSSISSRWESIIRALVNDSMSKLMPVALKERRSGEELSITTLVSGKPENLREVENIGEEMISRVFDVYVHVGIYVPPMFGVRENGAHLAVVGRGRDVANAKYSDWVRLRKPLEKWRPPQVTELLLSNDGDRILE